MIERQGTRRGRVQVRTIIAALVMLTGVVLMGYGYFQKEYLIFYTGAGLTVSGVVVETILAIVPASRDRRKGRIPKV